MLLKNRYQCYSHYLLCWMFHLSVLHWTLSYLNRIFKLVVLVYYINLKTPWIGSISIVSKKSFNSIKNLRNAWAKRKNQCWWTSCICLQNFRCNSSAFQSRFSICFSLRILFLTKKTLSFRNEINRRKLNSEIRRLSKFFVAAEN